MGNVLAARFCGAIHSYEKFNKKNQKSKKKPQNQTPKTKIKTKASWKSMGILLAQKVTHSQKFMHWTVHGESLILNEGLFHGNVSAENWWNSKLLDIIFCFGKTGN